MQNRVKRAQKFYVHGDFHFFFGCFRIVTRYGVTNRVTSVTNRVTLKKIPGRKNSHGDGNEVLPEDLFGPPHTRRAFVNESAGHAAARAGAAAATIPRGRHPEVLMQVFAESPQSLLRFFAPVAGRAQAADETLNGPAHGTHLFFRAAEIGRAH